MFSKLAFFSVVSVAVFVAASPSLGAHPVPAEAAVKQSSDHVTRGASKCNTGPVQCCDAVYESNSEETNFIQSFMGGADIVASGGGGGGGGTPPPAGMMASSCSPVGMGAGGSSSTCTGQTVCCQDNDYKGFLAFGCSPVNFFE
ncbi:hypothetical protein GALMADRAFT_230918 [Galerina marginata CBS 339.88]|uniref:Hydrophobin n=1 Tax=Galerina marginata (strain CBS 339.88) TaxID=685588 RepID=A0A067SQT4_GALM3|nr:hypothetical protein GALMADRAFT_230918 [Galerina marginata CBS 339.88]